MNAGWTDLHEVRHSVPHGVPEEHRAAFVRAQSFRLSEQGHELVRAHSLRPRVRRRHE